LPSRRSGASRSRSASTPPAWCRERILDIRPFVDKEGIGRCRLVLDPKCVPVRPRPYRAFQGWRYLNAKDAPPDLSRVAKGASNMPEPLRRELRELGLL